MSDWIDPDDAPELTEEVARHAEIRIGGKLVREATGYFAPEGFRVGRPPERGVAKRQVTLRLDGDVVDSFRADGPGWQSRINAALRKAAGI